ncbi:MAK10-like protein [Tanacetum coccineum]
MGNKNPIHTLRDYSKPSHEGYRNIIELPVGNNMGKNAPAFISIFPSRSRRTAKLRNDILMFQQHHGESLSEAWTHFKDLLQKVPYHGIDHWLQIQIFYDHVSFHLKCEIDRAVGGKLRNKNAKECWEMNENLALYDHEGQNPQPQALGTTFEAQVRDYIEVNTERMKRFESAILKQHEEINGRMTGMFGLLKELTTSRAPEKVMIREEAKSPITNNINSISLIREEEEKNDMYDVAPDDDRARAGKKKGKTYNVLPRGPVYEAILKKKIAKKEDIGGNFEIPCSIGGLKHVNALVDQGSDTLTSEPLVYLPLGIAEDILVEIAEHVYPVDFVILDIKEYKKRPFILGTPFLTTTKAVIKFDKGAITLSSGKSLESVEARLAHYKKNEVVYEESINVLNLEVKLRDNALVENKKKLEKAEKERDELKLTLEKFQNSSKSLNNLLESQVSVKFKTGLGYNAASSTAASPAVESFVNSSEMLENQEYNKSKSDKGYHAVPPPYTGNFIPFKPDLTFMDEIVKSENMDVTTIVTPSNVKTVESNHESAEVKSNGDAVEPKTVRKNNFRPPVIEDWNSDDDS